MSAESHVEHVDVSWYLGQQLFSFVLAAGHSRLIGCQFLPMLSSLPGFDYRSMPYFSYLVPLRLTV